MGSSKNWIAMLLASGVCLALFTWARAQDFPSGNIRLIVNVAAGGVTDSLARLVGYGLYEKWGKPAVVENLAGGNSSLAAQAVMRAKPDGHTLFVTADAPFTTTPLMVKKLYFTTADFKPVAVICRLVPVIAVNASLKVKTLQEFIALAKSRRGALNYGSQGVGTYGHLGMEDFKQRAGIDMVHVPYRGGAPANEALVRGDISVLISNHAAVAPFVQSGDVVLVAAADSRRSNTRPDLPTVMEQEISGFSVSTWFGIFAPAGVPPELVTKIRDGVETVLGSEKSAEFLKINSCERIKASPSQIADLIAADYKHWRTVIQAAGIQVE